MLERVEHRYRLPKGYFSKWLSNRARAPRRDQGCSPNAAERRRLAWHLPDDFDHRTKEEQAEILQWVRQTIISGTTDYRRYQSEKIKVPFAIIFPPLAVLNARKLGDAIALAGDQEGPLNAPL